MLDFGNRMQSGAKAENNGELFPAEELETASAVSEEKEESGSAVTETVKDEVAPENSRPAKRKRRNADDSMLDKLEASRILEEGRCRLGITPAEVEEITKIRAIYITALEQGNYEELPQAVYTLAYLRRLCELYGFTGEEEQQVTAPWSDIQCEVPESYPGTLYSDEAGENGRIIRKLELVIFSIIACAVIGLIVFGVVLLVSLAKGSGAADSVHFDEASIVKLQPSPVLNVKEELPQNRAR